MNDLHQIGCNPNPRRNGHWSGPQPDAGNADLPSLIIRISSGTFSSV
jgi:hypothetical protein